MLGALDDKIELNRRMNETLESMARTLFKSWFVDFDPVRAKMAGRWRRGDSLPGLPAEHYDLFPDRLVDSELGEMPEGWGREGAGGRGEVESPRTNGAGHRGLRTLTWHALPTSGSSPDEHPDTARIPSPVHTLSQRRYTTGTDNSLLGKRQDGLCPVTCKRYTAGWGSTEFIVMRAITPVPSEFTYLLARDTAFREHAIQSMTGTSGRQRVQVDALAPYPLPSPPKEVWAGFGALVGPLLAQIEIDRRESLALAAQRDALLPRLVSGELRVGF